MDNRDKPESQYSGTKGLSLAIVIGAALGTAIGKWLDKMNVGLMIGLVLAVCIWTLVINRRSGTVSPEREEAAKDEASGGAGGDDSLPE